MGDVDEKEKAEKLAAAKKRFEQLKKQKGKGGRLSSTIKKEEQPEAKESVAPSKDDQQIQEPQDGHEYNEERVYAEAPEGSDVVKKDSTATKADVSDKPSHKQQPSLGLQSRMRSASFRGASLSQGPLSPTANGTKSPDLWAVSPDGESVNSIYRKQAARLEELEKENKRLTQEAQDAQRKLKRTEEELDELREASGQVADLKSKAQRLDAQTEELSKMRQENTSLQRQNSQLQSQTSKRHASSPSQANTSNPIAALQSQLDSKSSTLGSMEMEICSLRSQLDKSTTSIASYSEQVAALEEKLERAERAAGNAQRELADAKKSIERASEKALREGTEKTSAETKIRNLTREAEESRKTSEQSLKRIEILEKKLLAVTNMSKDADARRQAGERERGRLEREAIKFHGRLASLENENLQMREERNKNNIRHVQGTDDEGLDELEDAEKRRLEVRIRDLESEVFELRRGVWRERRRSVQPNMEGDDSVSSPGGKFDDIDLNGPSPYRRQSNAGGRGTSFSNVLASGLSAFTSAVNSGRDDLQEFGDDAFDESAFKQAQEEEAVKRIERVKEIKRSLKDWEGWRMDIVDLRRAGGGGVGEIFDV